MQSARQSMKDCGFLTAATDRFLRIENEEKTARAWLLFIKTGNFLDYDGAPFKAATKLRPVPVEKVHAATAAREGA